MIFMSHLLYMHLDVVTVLYFQSLYVSCWKPEIRHGLTVQEALVYRNDNGLDLSCGSRDKERNLQKKKKKDLTEVTDLLYESSKEM